MTEKQYSKKKLFEKITCQIPRTTVNSVQEVKVIADFNTKSFYAFLFILANTINRVSFLTKQTTTSGKKSQFSLFSLLLCNTNNCLTSSPINFTIKLPYYSNKENASSLADNVFF